MKVFISKRKPDTLAVEKVRFYMYGQIAVQVFFISLPFATVANTERSTLFLSLFILQFDNHIFFINMCVV